MGFLRSRVLSYDNHTGIWGAVGRQATLQYSQVVAYFKPLYQQLKDRTCPPEMVAGIWMYIQDIQSRNYLHATDIYMHLAVGKHLCLARAGDQGMEAALLGYMSCASVVLLCILRAYLQCWSFGRSWCVAESIHRVPLTM